MVILMLAGSPSTTTTLPPAASTSDASSVPSGSPRVGGPQRRGPEGLRRLHRDEPAAVDGAPADLAASVSDTGTAGTARVGARRRRRRARVPHAGHRHRPGGVVHDDHRRRRRARRPARPAPTPSGSRRRRPRPSASGLGLVGPVGGHDEHHAVGALGRGAQGPVEDPLAAEGAGTACARRSARRCRRPRRSPRWTWRGRYRP